MARISYDLHLVGTGEDGDVEKLQAAFRDVVQRLRMEGVTVEGAFTGNLQARRDETTGELIDAIVIHDFAQDVEDETPDAGGA